jgi:outer membrane protein assembly factor BamB
MKLAALATLSLGSVAASQDARWPQFLGPRGTAVVESKPASLAFDLERDVLFRVALPRGSSSPCIAGDRLFLSASEGEELLMLALDRQSGAELWRRTRKAPLPPEFAHVDADPAAPTACTDGERVAFYFGEYGLVVLDLAGELLWEQPLPPPQAPFGLGSSPIFVDDLLILSRDGCPDSAIHAYAKQDGTPRWSVPRIGFTYSFGTPFVWQSSARRELVVAGTQRLTGLDPASGKELWQLAGLTSFVCTTPTADAETLYFAAWSTPDAAPAERSDDSWGELEFTPEELADGSKAFARLDANGDGRLEHDEFPPSRAKDAFNFVDRDGDGVVVVAELAPLIESPKGDGNNLVVAVAAGGSGDIEKTHVRWTQRRGVPYVASPLLYQGRLYLARAGGLLTCLDPKTGSPFFGPERLDDHSEYYASPVGVDGHVLVCSSAGTIHVLRASDELELVRAVELGEPIQATPAIVDGTVYVRSAKALWAFGK